METYNGRNYITYKDIMKKNGVSRATAYKILRENFTNEDFETIKIKGTPKPINTAILYHKYIEKMGTNLEEDIIFRKMKKETINKYKANPRAMAEKIVALEFQNEELENSITDYYESILFDSERTISGLKHDIFNLKNHFKLLQNAIEAVQVSEEKEIKAKLKELQNKLSTYIEGINNETAN